MIPSGAPGPRGKESKEKLSPRRGLAGRPRYGRIWQNMAPSPGRPNPPKPPIGPGSPWTSPGYPLRDDPSAPQDTPPYTLQF